MRLREVQLRWLAEVAGGSEDIDGPAAIDCGGREGRDCWAMRTAVAAVCMHRYGESANGTDIIGELGIPGVGFGEEDAYGLPLFDIQGYDPIGDSLLCTPCQYWNNNFQIGERVTWSTGHHSIKFGGDARKFNWDMLGFFQNRGWRCC